MNDCIVKYIKTDDLDIIHSGVFIINGDNVEVGLQILNFEFSIKFAFFTDGTKGTELRHKINGDNEVVFECFNFMDLGTGTTNPIKIAVIDGRDTFMSFSAEKIAGKCRKIEYSIGLR